MDASLSPEVRGLGRILRSPAPYAVLLLALVLLGLAYQTNPALSVIPGSKTDRPFWRGTHDVEEDKAAAFIYRWTGPTSTLTLPAVGSGEYTVRLELNGSRPEGFPPPELLISAGGVAVADLRPIAARQFYTITVPAAASSNGDIRLNLVTRNPFSPPSDRRELGVVVGSVEVLPGPFSLRLPPLAVWGQLAGAAVLITLVLGVAGWVPRTAGAGGLIFTLMAAGFLLWDRLWLTLVADVLPPVLLLAGLLVVLLGPLWRLLYRAGGIPLPTAEGRILLAIFALTFAVRLAGQLHPQIRIIDLVFHVHRFEQVHTGDLLFTIASNEWAGRQTFYLPTAYVFMLPLEWLIRDMAQTIRLFTVLLDTMGVFLVYYLARRAFGDGRAGLLAALLGVTFPLAVLPFSWGITANLFGQFTGLAALCVAYGLYERLHRPGPWLALVIVLVPALLSHPGNVQLSALLLGGTWLVWAGVDLRRNKTYRQALAFGSALAVAAAIAWFGYYQHFAAQQLATLAEIRAERAEVTEREGFSIRVGGGVNDWSLGLRQRIVKTREEWQAAALPGFAAEAWAYFHTWPLLWAVLGFVGVRGWGLGSGIRDQGSGSSNRRSLIPDPRSPIPDQRRFLWAALVWAGVVLLYALVGWAANLFVRYALFAMPLVALGSGLFLSALARRGLAGRVMVALIMLAFTLEALVFWYVRISFANKS